MELESNIFFRVEVDVIREAGKSSARASFQLHLFGFLAASNGHGRKAGNHIEHCESGANAHDFLGAFGNEQKRQGAENPTR